jgi:hypothetical protein
VATESLIFHQLGQRIPAECEVPSGVFPITHLGEISKARILTVGLNPSPQEYFTKLKPQLTYLSSNSKRLINRDELNLSPRGKPNEDQLVRVMLSMDRYFSVGQLRSDYKMLQEYILSTADASYKKGSAAHSFAVQWPTLLSLAKINGSTIKEDLVRDNSQFLVDLVTKSPSIEKVLINGPYATKLFRDAGHFKVLMEGALPNSEAKYYFGTLGKQLAWGWDVCGNTSRDIVDWKTLSDWFGSGGWAITVK